MSTDPILHRDSEELPEELPSCTLVLELLPEFVGEDLDPATATIVGRHLQGCLSCARESRALRSAREALLSLREVEGPGEDFFTQMRQEVLAEIQHGEQVRSDHDRLVEAVGERRPRSALTLVGIQVASLAAAVLLGMWIGRGFLTPTPETGSQGGDPLTGRSLPQSPEGLGDLTPVGMGKELGDRPLIERLQQPEADRALRVLLQALRESGGPRPVVPSEIEERSVEGLDYKDAKDF